MDSHSHNTINLDEVEELESVNNVETLGPDSESLGTQNRRETSKVWRHFEKVGVGKDGVQRAACNACKQQFKCGGKRYGTSTLRRHIESCNVLKCHDVGQMWANHEGKKRAKNINQKFARELLASAVIKHDLPFSFVEYEGIRAWMTYLNPEIDCISRNTLVSDITRMYIKEKDKLKQALAISRSRICLTSDLWTACTSEGYICLTAHFVDEDWKLNSKILNFAHMPPPHSGVELAATLFGFLKDWGIERKVFSLTLDNASSNDNLQVHLKGQLSLYDSLLCNGEFFHVRCCAHILNLIVQEGLKVATPALNKIRESVKYVKGSEVRMKKFEECVSKVGNIDTSIGLRLDVATRWNSTYLMLESALKYDRAFASLQLIDKNYKYCPSIEEWKRGEKICEFLEPFYETTNLISGSSYPTSNLYFMQVWKIEVLLKENLSSQDSVISDMCKRMLDKFDKYWNEYSMVLAFGAVLDPRIKLTMLQFFYSKVEVDVSKCHEKLSLVKTKLYNLYGEYSSASKTSSPIPNYSKTSTSAQSTEGIKGKGKRIFDEIKAYESQTIISAGRSELDLYLDEPKLEFSFYENLDVLDYWRSQHRYPTLALMACDVLAIPITTVASESSFSIGARVLTKYRSCILPEKVQTLVCTRNWLHGFACETEASTSGKETLPSETQGSTSNVLGTIYEDVEDGE